VSILVPATPRDGPHNQVKCALAFSRLQYSATEDGEAIQVRVEVLWNTSSKYN
jgi:hypothetical protein